MPAGIRTVILMNQLPQGAIEAFRTEFVGPVVFPEDSQYNEVRQIWNAMIDRKPSMIARCVSAEDVTRCLNLVLQYDMPFSVRGGGHNIAGNAVCDDGLMIDLSLMKGTHIDQENRRAYVEPGCTLADFDAAAQAYGLATPLGINSTTGVAGLTLGGGFGWLSRKFGMTVDNLLSTDVVVADGRQLHASKSENTDLFWGLCGGGGNFGIVTRFEYQLHPVGPDVLCGLMVFPFEEAKSLLMQFATFSKTMPDDLNIWVVLRKAPPLPFLHENIHGQEVVVFAIFYAGDPHEGEKYIEALRSFGTAHGEHIGLQPYAAWQQAFDPLLTAGARNYWKSHNFATLDEGVIDAITEYASNLPSSQSEIFIATLGGQTGRVSADAMAYSSRDANYVLNVHTRWESADQDADCIAWAREFFKRTQPFASEGAYINFLTADESERVAFAYGESYKRLVDLKKKFDPANLFRVNQNISPT